MTLSAFLDPERDPMHPSLRALEGVAFDDAAADLEEARLHVGGCPACAARVASLRSARSDFLRSRPTRPFLESLERRARADPGLEPRLLGRLHALVGSLSGASGRRRGGPAVGLALVSGLALAGAAMVLVVPEPLNRGTEIRLKGSPRAGLRLLAAPPGASVALPLGDEARLEPGAILRFEVDLESEGYLTLLNIDDHGRITRYFPAPGERPTKMPPGRGQILPGSIELDDFIGRERLFLVISEAGDSEGVLEAALADAFEKAERRLEGLRIPPRTGRQVITRDLLKVPPGGAPADPSVDARRAAPGER